jgi:hypothetical protein
MAAAAPKLPAYRAMLQQHRETEMTELDERIAIERERAELLKKQMACGCPDRCDIDHDN